MAFKKNMKTVKLGKKEFDLWVSEKCETSDVLKENPNKAKIMAYAAYRRFLKEKTYYGTPARVKGKLIRIFNEMSEKEFLIRF